MDQWRKFLYYVLQKYKCLKNTDDCWFCVLILALVFNPGSSDQRKRLPVCHILLSIWHILNSVSSVSAFFATKGPSVCTTTVTLMTWIETDFSQ